MTAFVATNWLEYRHSKHTHVLTPAAFTAAVTRWASARDSVIGFSMMRCLPALAAATI